MTMDTQQAMSTETVAQSTAPRRPECKKDLPWSDQVDTAQGVIWGEQISNTIRKLKSLTFFAVGTKPHPLPQALEGSEEGNLDDKGSNRRKVKGNAGGARGGRRGRNARQGRRRGGSPAPPMGSDDTTSPDDLSASNVPEPVFGLDDVANYECVSAEGIKMDVKEHLDPGSDRGDESEKGRRRRSNANGDKPNNTYTEIITTALEENPEGLTVSEIYDYISSRYGYYQPNDDRWKNSVRHNLSISPYFHKGDKSKHGAGHVWTIAEDCKDIRLSRRRLGSGLIPKGVEKEKAEVTSVIDMTKLKTETDFAVASILGDYTRACNGKGQENPPESDSPPPSLTLIEMSSEHQNNNYASSSTLGLGVLDCQEIELQLEEMETYVNSETHEILSMEMDSSQPSLCMLEGEIVDVDNVDEGMILNLNSYFQPEELQAIFFEQSLEKSLTPSSSVHDPLSS